MTSFETTLPTAPREAGVVYTKPWMVELVLDLAGYVPERRLSELVALEPSAGDGAFLSAMVRRLVESCERHGTPLAKASSALQAFEIDPEAAEKAEKVVRETLISLRIQPDESRRAIRSTCPAGRRLVLDRTRSSRGWRHRSHHPRLQQCRHPGGFLRPLDALAPRP